MKRSVFHLAIVAMLSCMLTSCTTKSYTYMTSVPVSKLSDYTTEYVGKPHNYIVSSLGAPDRQTSDGAGGTILIYEETTVTSTSSSNSVAAAYNVNYFNKTYTPGTATTTQSVQSANTSYIHLFVNSEGVCYNVKTNHQKIIQEEREGQRKALSKGGKITLWTSYGVAVVAFLAWVVSAVGV